MSRVNCAECKGACCESFGIPRTALRLDGDTRRWLELHATESAGMLHFECACTELTYHGTCGIYPSRPEVCRDFVMGSQRCLDVVRERRPELLEGED